MADDLPDIEAARAAGYSDKEILAAVGPTMGADVGAALKAGYSASDVLNALMPPKAPQERPAAPPPKEEPAPEPVSGRSLGVAKAVGQGLTAIPGNLIKTAGEVTQGAGIGVESGVQGAIGNAQEFQRKQTAIMDRIDAGEQIKPEEDPLGYADASPEQRTKIRAEQDASVAKMPSPENTIAGALAERLGEKVKEAGRAVSEVGKSDVEAAKALIPLTPEEQNRPEVRVAQTVTGIIPYLLSGAIAGVPGMAAYGGAESFGKTFDEAKEAGASDEDAAGAAAISGLVQGGLNVVPAHRALTVLDRVPNAFKGEFVKTLTEMAKSAGTLLGFSQVSQVADNIIAKETFDPTREVKQGLGEHMAETAIAGALLPAIPAAGAAAAARFRARTPAEVAKPVLEAKTTDEAITAAQNVVAEGVPVDISETLRNAEYGTTGEQKQAQLLKLFGGRNEGTVEQTGDGNYQFRKTVNGEDTAEPIKVWDPNAKPVEGETPTQATITPELAKAQQDHYDSLGMKVVYFENDARIPFDGVVDPTQPNTIFLSNDPQRNAAQVGAHELTHLLENTTLPDGTNLGDMLHSQVREGMTPEGRAYAEKLFGPGAPKRAAFPEGITGDSAHADAVVNHLVSELSADIGGEAPKFMSFAPKVVDAIEQRYGADAAKGVLQKLIAGFKNALDTMRSFFSRADEHPEYGQTPTVSQHWVTNLEAIHDTLAKMYAVKFGERVERENAALATMREKVQRDRFLAGFDRPASEVPPPAAPEGFAAQRPAEAAARPAAEAPAAALPPEAPRPPGPMSNPAAYAEAASRAATLRRWLSDLDDERRSAAPAGPQATLLKQTEAAILAKVRGVEDRLTKVAAERLTAVRSQIDALRNPDGDSPDMAKVRQALAVEQQRMADAASAPRPEVREPVAEKAQLEEALPEPEPVAEKPRVEAGGDEPKFSPRQTETPEFKEWFARSKMVDRDGKPSVFYHGTDSDIESFQPSKSRFGNRGMYFSKDSGLAGIYADHRAERNEGAATVYPVYLKIENPKVIDNPLWEKIKARFTGNKSRLGTDFAKSEEARSSMAISDKDLTDLKAQGYDGIVNKIFNEVVVFNPEQVKSAIGNSGAFDPANPDIRMSPRITGENKARVYTPEEQKAFENVGRTTTPKTWGERFADLTKDAGKRTIAATMDPYIGVKASDPKGYLALRNANTSAGANWTFMNEGTLKFDGSAYNFKDRNGGIKGQLLEPLGNEAHDFIWWVAANRAERLKGEDRENLFGDTDIAALKKLNQGQADFDYTLSNGKTTRSREAIYLDALGRMDAFNKNVMDLSVEAGLLDRKNVDALFSNPFYVPFYRQAVEGDGKFTGGSVSSGFVKQNAFKTLKGGSEKLNNDLWENAFGNWGHMIDAAISNKAVVQVLDTAAAPGGNASARKMTSQEALHLSDKELKSRTVWTMEGGKKQYYEITDPTLFNAVAALDALGDPMGLLTAGRAFKRVLQVGVTMNPAFAVRNIIRDTQQTLAVSPQSANVAKTFADAAKMNDMGTAFTNIARAAAGQELKAAKLSDEAVSAIAGGATMRLASGVDTGIRDTKISTVLDNPEKMKAFTNYLGTLARSYQKAMEQGEDVNRMSLYKNLREQGVPHDAASFAARDLADFTLSGAATPVRILTATIPFLNARIQGLYKVGRSLTNADQAFHREVGLPDKSSTARAAVVIGATTLAVLALDAIYADDPDYKKRTEFDRNTYYWFKFGGAEIRVPMGFEIAAMSRLAANTAEVFFSKEMTGRRLAESAWQLIGTNLQMNPIPQAVKPLYDVATNTSGTGQHIVPMGLENLRPDERYTGRSTLAARGLSTAVNSTLRAIPGMKGVEGPSPVQLDYLVQAYGGWLATTSLGMADTAVRSFTSEPVRPAGDVWSTVTQGMISTEPRGSSRYVEMLYTQGKQVEQAYASYRNMIAMGHAAEAAQFFADNKETLQKHGLVSGIMRLESNLNRQQRIIENSTTLSAEQKKISIQALSAAKNKAAQQAFEAR